MQHSNMAPTALKRNERSVSTEALSKLEGREPAASKQRCGVEPAAAAPLLAPFKGESKAAYFARLGRRLRRDASLFSPATAFDRDGLYIYKRPVRSGSGNKAALLASGGGVFNHVVVYIKTGDELAALEFGPANTMDITDNMLLETPAAPVLLHPAPPPEPQHLPMLHIGLAHHPLDAAHVEQALAFAQARPYHALCNNCICFADFVVRVLTGGVVRGAPLIFDLLVGQVPLVDSPLLALLALTAQLTWHDVTDGGRLTHAFLQQHPGALLPPPGCCREGAPLPSILIEPAEPAEPAADEDKEVAAMAGAPAGTCTLPAAAPPLAAFLAAMAGGAGVPGTARAVAAVPADSGSSEDTVGGLAEPATEAAATDTAAAVAVAGSSATEGGATAGAPAASLASSGSSRVSLGVQGLHLPARRASPAAKTAAHRAALPTAAAVGSTSA